MDHTLHALPSHEIPAAIDKASVFGGKLAQPSSTKNPSTIITRLDIDSCGVILITLLEELPLEKKRPVSVRLNYRNISFNLSSEDYTVEGSTIIGQIPKSAKAIPIRDTERCVFPLDSKISGHVQRVEKRGFTNQIGIELVDVSRNGLGFLVKNADPETIMRNDHIWIKSVNGIMLEKAIFGTIIYVNQRNYKDTIDLKCGVSLETSIPENIYQELSGMCRLILKG